MIRYMVFNKDVYDSYVEKNINININAMYNGAIKSLWEFDYSSIIDFGLKQSDFENIKNNKELTGHDLINFIIEDDPMHMDLVETINSISGMSLDNKKRFSNASEIMMLGIYNCYFANEIDEITDLNMIDNLQKLKSKQLKKIFPLSFCGKKIKKNKVYKFVLNKAGSEIFKYISQKKSDLLKMINATDIDDYINPDSLFKIEKSYYNSLKGLYEEILNKPDSPQNDNCIYNKYNEIYLAEMIFGFCYSIEVYEFMENIKLEAAPNNKMISKFNKLDERRIIIDLAKTVMIIKDPLLRIEVFNLISSKIKFVEIDKKGTMIIDKESKEFIEEIMKILNKGLIKSVNDVFDFRVFAMFCRYKNIFNQNYNEAIAEFSKKIGENLEYVIPLKPNIEGFDYSFNAIQISMFQSFKKQYKSIDEVKFNHNVENYIKRFESNKPLGDCYIPRDYVNV